MVYDACSGWTTIVIPALQGTIPVIAARILPKTGHSWSSLSSCYISRVTLRLSTLRDSQQNTDPQSSILDFEKETVAIDSAIKGKVEGTCVCMYMWLSTKQSLFIHYRKQLEEYWTHGHPYPRGLSITGSRTWSLCMNPLMSQVLHESEFIEVDITYRASVELTYLFNVHHDKMWAVSLPLHTFVCVLSFDPGMVVVQVQLNHLDTAT